MKLETRRILVLGGTALALPLIIAVSLGIGTVSLPLKALAMTLVTGSTVPAAQDAAQESFVFYRNVILQIRLPRILTACLTGLNLALAGTVLQGSLRNPLASPQIIGVNAGAAFAAILVMLLFPELFSLVPPAAFAGALCAALTVYLLSRKTRGAPTTGIVLAGVAVSSLLSALTSGIMIVFSDSLEITYSWLVGGLSGRGWKHVRLILPYTLAGSAGMLYMAPKLNLFALGDETGGSLGLSVKFHRTFSLLLGALLAGSAVSVGGTIGFIGLIAPHAARLAVGSDYRFIVPLAAAFGAILLSASDLAARTLLSPAELPVGVVTAALGAPFFLILLTRQSK